MSQIGNLDSPFNDCVPELVPVLEAFDFIRRKFDDFAKVTGCGKFWTYVYPAQEALIVAYITEAFTKLECDLSSVKSGEAVPNVHHVRKYDKLTARLMCALQDYGLITRSANGWIRTSKPVPSQLSSFEQYETILTDFPQFALEHRLLHIVGAKLDECLAGKVNPVKLLFGSPEKRQLVADQYAHAPIQSAVSQQLTCFIKQCFRSRTADQTLRVLEIGGGTCGTSIHAVDAFSQLNVSIEYTFTDISPSFITAAKSKLRAHKFIRYQTLDITSDPSPDMPGHYDMIIATNVMHATPNVCKSARNARRLLRPGGFATFIEYTQPLYITDVIFGQLDGWWLFEDGREHAIMNASEWNRTLRQSGFERVDWTGGKSEESKILRIFLAY